MNKKRVVTISIILCVLVISIVSIFFIKNNSNQINNEENKIFKVSTYNNPIIPKGFEKVETENASWEKDENGNIKGWNNGLVIQDEIGNQFVWIPISDKYVDEEFIISDNEEEIQLFKYGGFYVSRFEAGVPKNLQSNLESISAETNDIIGVPVSQKNIIPWNYISYKNANESAKLMYNTENVKSGLMSLNKSVIIVNWLKSNGFDVNNSTDWGNYSNTSYKFSGLYSADTGSSYKLANNMLKDDNMILATGITDRNLANNIYDFAGNVREYTSTQYENSKYHYSVGGYYAKSGEQGIGASATEQYAFADEPISTTGFRIYLEIIN